MTEKALTLKEVAGRLDISTRTVTRMAESGEILGYRVGHAWRFEPKDIEDYINQQRNRSQKKAAACV